MHPENTVNNTLILTIDDDFTTNWYEQQFNGEHRCAQPKASRFDPASNDQ